MSVCGICREIKESKNKWTIHEHSCDSSLLREFKICEGCATDVIRKVLKEMNPEKVQENQTILSGTSILDTVILYPDNSVEFVLSMDLAKSRKLVLESAEKGDKAQREKENVEQQKNADQKVADQKKEAADQKKEAADQKKEEKREAAEQKKDEKREAAEQKKEEKREAAEQKK